MCVHVSGPLGPVLAPVGLSSYPWSSGIGSAHCHEAHRSLMHACIAAMNVLRASPPGLVSKMCERECEIGRDRKCRALVSAYLGHVVRMWWVDLRNGHFGSNGTGI